MRWLLIGYALVAVTLGVGLGWLVVRDIDWGELRDTLSTPRLPLALVAWGLTFVAGYIRGIRWRMLMDWPKVSALRLYVVEQTGTGVDTLSPVRVLDEVVEVGLLTLRDKLDTGIVLATLALQRTFEFTGMVLIIGIGALFLAPMRQFWPYLTAGIVFGSASLILLFTIGPALSRIPLIKRLGIVPQFASAVTLLWSQKRRAAIAFGLSVIQAMLTGLAGWMVALATDLSVGIFVVMIITVAVMLFTGAVPGLPMAFGTFEFAAFSLLELWDQSAAQAGAFAVMLRAVMFFPPAIFALVVLSREGLLSWGKLRDFASAGMAGSQEAPNEAA